MSLFNPKIQTLKQLCTGQLQLSWLIYDEVAHNEPPYYNEPAHLDNEPPYHNEPAHLELPSA